MALREALVAANRAVGIRGISNNNFLLFFLNHIQNLRLYKDSLPFIMPYPSQPQIAMRGIGL
jgi:hypothetical protein